MSVQVSQNDPVMIDATLQRGTPIKHTTLAAIILQRFNLPPDAVAEARREAEASNTRLELQFAKNGLISDAQLALASAEYLDMPVLSLENFRPDEELIASMPNRVLHELSVLPLCRWDNTMAVAMVEPFDVLALDEMCETSDCTIVPYVAPRNQLIPLLQAYGEDGSQGLARVLEDMTGAAHELEITEESITDVDEHEMASLATDAPVVRIVNALLVEALLRGASDIHIEPGRHTMHVRYRIDGVLYDEPSPPHPMQWAIISRIKIMSKLDIAERRMPQDGRFTINALHREADIRVSMIPTVHGQKAVMRVLDKTKLKPNLASLGLDREDYQPLSDAIHQPWGLILVTGPTGSGKTTTLYSALQELNRPEVNIVTVENPVEYQLARISQIQTHTEIGLTFARVLRSILRQDPDIIMVGEIRDVETASIAIQASLTGHLVLTTLHTNDAAGAIVRLLQMEIEPFLIVSSLILAQAQRLYRRLCPHCKRPQMLGEDILLSNGIAPSRFRDKTVFEPQGCPRCNRTGYQGRDVIMELITLTESIRDMILKATTTDALRNRAISEGMVSLRERGIQRVLRGDTSLEETLRVTARLTCPSLCMNHDHPELGQ
jgi:type IV pilus assembly protein PilB